MTTFAVMSRLDNSLKAFIIVGPNRELRMNHQKMTQVNNVNCGYQISAQQDPHFHTKSASEIGPEIPCSKVHQFYG